MGVKVIMFVGMAENLMERFIVHIIARAESTVCVDLLFPTLSPVPSSVYGRRNFNAGGNEERGGRLE